MWFSGSYHLTPYPVLSTFPSCSPPPLSSLVVSCEPLPLQTPWDMNSELAAPDRFVGPIDFSLDPAATIAPGTYLLAICGLISPVDASDNVLYDDNYCPPNAAARARARARVCVCVCVCVCVDARTRVVPDCQWMEAI